MADTKNLFASASKQDDVKESPMPIGKSPMGSGIGLVRELESGPTRIGRGPKPVDVRKYGNFDVLRARGTKVKFSATKDDRMPAEAAGIMLQRIQAMFGLDREDESIVHAFNNALFYAHTVNSGSTLQPGRCKLIVGNSEFDYVDVVRLLREDLRRFFRAYADDIAVVNKEILDAYDPYNHEAMEMYGAIMAVATERGLSKYPMYAHDSSDACVDIQPTVRSAIAQSKRMVISTIVNSADTLHANTRVQSRDNYDSTNGAHVAADRGAVSGRMGGN